MNNRLRHIGKELQEHLPYTIFSVITGMVVLGIITTLVNPDNFPHQAKGLFHIFHPLHLLFSATATTTMFWRHDKKLFKSIFIGLVGAVGICGISDIFLPFLAGMLLGHEMHLHICMFIHIDLILPFIFLGIFTGLIIPRLIQSTLFSHAAHVFLSSMASILYLVSFGLTNWIEVGGMVLVYMVLAVMIPCCMSDIIFPLLLVKETKQGKS